MSDYETVKAMRDANWKPAVTYWKEKCDQADATIARLTAERDELKEQLRAEMDEHADTIRLANKAEAERDEALAENEALRQHDRMESARQLGLGTFAQGIEAAANEWQNVRVEGGAAVAAVMAYSDRIRGLAPQPEADPVREAAMRDKIARIIIEDQLQLLSDFDVDGELYRHDPECGAAAYVTADAILRALAGGQL